MRLLAYCLLPEHVRVLVWPRCDGDLSNFNYFCSAVPHGLN